VFPFQYLPFPDAGSFGWFIYFFGSTPVSSANGEESCGAYISTKFHTPTPEHCGGTSHRYAYGYWYGHVEGYGYVTSVHNYNLEIMVDLSSNYSDIWGCGAGVRMGIVSVMRKYEGVVGQ
jgi:hypothetical protein